MATTEKVKIPLKWRLKAWWEGYDIEELKARIRDRMLLSDDPHGVGAGTSSEFDTRDDETLITSDKKVVRLPWDDARMEIAQLIWGDGYCGPGGPDHIIAMSKLLAMSPKMSAVVIGAGLGGPARALAQEFGVWITGYEAAEPLAIKGMELSTMAGLQKKAPITHFDPASSETFERTFDRAFSKEASFTVEDKAGLYKNVEHNLKKDGLFLISDYVLSDDSLIDNGDVKDWIAQEPLKPHPCSHQTMEQDLKDAGFVIRVNEDITDMYMNMISQAWAGADKVIAKLAEDGPDSRNVIDTLLREAEFWTRRTRLMEQGHLKVWRFLASKPTVI
mgnify:CR=1 FL=1